MAHVEVVIEYLPKKMYRFSENLLPGMEIIIIIIFHLLHALAKNEKLIFCGEGSEFPSLLNYISTVEITPIMYKFTSSSSSAYSFFFEIK